MGKRIGILTQPLGGNYGGILQNYALQKVLRDLGHEPITIDRQYKRPWYKVLARPMVDVAKYMLGKSNRWRSTPSVKENAIIQQHTQKFISKYINRSAPIHTTMELREFHKKNSIEGYVVGSDQVWRKIYSPHLPNFFLDFIEGEKEIKRVAYAASFGTGKWEGLPNETKHYRQLLQAFDAVSVREESGITLCKDIFDADAKLVLDPTMLLSAEDYRTLAYSEVTKPLPEKSLFCYILDKNIEKQRIVERYAEERSLKITELLPKSFSNLKQGEDLSNAVLPPVEQWLRCIADSDLVITDSFHGTVFSLIFGKEVICIPNKKRGSDRFKTLFNNIGIKDCTKYINNSITISVNIDITDSLIFKELQNYSTKVLVEHIS